MRELRLLWALVCSMPEAAAAGVAASMAPAGFPGAAADSAAARLGCFMMEAWERGGWGARQTDMDVHAPRLIGVRSSLSLL